MGKIRAGPDQGKRGSSELRNLTRICILRSESKRRAGGGEVLAKKVGPPLSHQSLCYSVPTQQFS